MIKLRLPRESVCVCVTWRVIQMSIFRSKRKRSNKKQLENKTEKQIYRNVYIRQEDETKHQKQTTFTIESS